MIASACTSLLRSAQLDDGGLAKALPVGEQGAVDETRLVPVLADGFLSPAAVDVAEDVKPGSAAEHGAGELAAAEVLAEEPLAVECAEGRPMGEEHIDPLGHPGPKLAQVRDAAGAEGPVGQDRSDGRAPEAQATDCGRGVFKVHGVAEALASLLGVALEKQVVAAGDDNFVRVGQPGEPVVKILDLSRIGAGTQEITRMSRNSPQERIPFFCCVPR